MVLMSHANNYYHAGSSGQQQIGAINGYTANTNFVVKVNFYGRGSHKAGEPVQYGQPIQLEHQATRKNLHSHNAKSPVTSQQEVTAFGTNGSGDLNDDWTIISTADANVGGVKTGQLVRLLHTSSRTFWLHSHDAKFKVVKDVGPEIQEVTACSPGDPNDYFVFTVTPSSPPKPEPVHPQPEPDYPKPDLANLKPEPLLYGQTVSLVHGNTKSILMSHLYNYYHTNTSGQQQVVASPDQNPNTTFVVKAANGSTTKFGEPVQYGHVIRLEHKATKKNLHSHRTVSPATGQQEVTAYGANGTGDSNDNWTLESKDSTTATGFLKPGDLIRLMHTNSGTHRLHSHGSKFKVVKDVGPDIQEVTAYPHPGDSNDIWSFTISP